MNDLFRGRSRFITTFTSHNGLYVCFYSHSCIKIFCNKSTIVRLLTHTSVVAVMTKPSQLDCCSLIIEVWQKIGQKKNLSPIIDHLLDTLTRYQPYEELETIDAKTKKPVRRAVLVPFTVQRCLLSDTNSVLNLMCLWCLYNVMLINEFVECTGTKFLMRYGVVSSTVQTGMFLSDVV